MSKPKLRTRLAALSFSEKIQILEKLRNRDRAIATAGLRKARRTADKTAATGNNK